MRRCGQLTVSGRADHFSWSIDGRPRFPPSICLAPAFNASYQPEILSDLAH